MMRLAVLSVLLAAASASYAGSPVVVSDGWSHGGLGGWGNGGWGNGGWGAGGWGNGGWGDGGWSNGGWGRGGWGNGGWGHGAGWGSGGWGHGAGWGSGLGLGHGYSTVVKTTPVIATAPVVVKTVAPVASSYSSSWKAPSYGHGGLYGGGWGGSGYGWGGLGATSYQNVYKVSKPVYSGLSYGSGHGYGHGYGYGGHGGWW